MRVGLNLLFLIPGEVGGTETYAQGLLKALAREDTSNDYIIFVNRESRNLDFIRQNNFSVVECEVSATNRAARFLWEQFILPIQAHRAGLDILHSLGYVMPLVLPCKSIVTIHDLNYRFVPESMTYITRIFQRVFVTASAHRSNHIIAVSEFVREQIMAFLKAPAEKVTTIHEAVEREIFVPGERDPGILEHYGISRPYIIAFSSLTPHKNIPSLLRAFALIKHNASDACQLVIVGHQPRFHPSLKEIAINLGLDKSEVIFTGYINSLARNVLLSNASIFVFPSFYEGFGLPVLEAMSVRVAVACSECASLPEIAGNAAEYFDPNNIAEIAHVLLRLIKDRDRRDILTKQGIKNLERFSWERTARQTMMVYKQVFSG